MFSFTTIKKTVSTFIQAYVNYKSKCLFAWCKQDKKKAGSAEAFLGKWIHSTS